MTDVIPQYAGLSGNKLRHAITATATIGFLLFGYDQGVMSGIVRCPSLSLLLCLVLIEEKDHRRAVQQRVSCDQGK